MYLTLANYALATMVFLNLFMQNRNNNNKIFFLIILFLCFAGLIINIFVVIKAKYKQYNRN